MIVDILIYGFISIQIVEGAGYFFHRFVNHESKWGVAICFPHWVHHIIYPAQDMRRDEYHGAGDWTFYLLYFLCCFSVGMLVPLGILDWKNYLIMFIIASTWGYIGQSYFHTVFHLSDHLLHRFDWFQTLMRLHRNHHLGPWNYGVTFFWWDHVCRTFNDSVRLCPENQFPNVPEHIITKWHTKTAT